MEIATLLHPEIFLPNACLAPVNRDFIPGFTPFAFGEHTRVPSGSIVSILFTLKGSKGFNRVFCATHPNSDVYEPSLFAWLNEERINRL